MNCELYKEILQASGEAVARLMFDPKALLDLRALAHSVPGSRNAELFTAPAIAGERGSRHRASLRGVGGSQAFAPVAMDVGRQRGAGQAGDDSQADHLGAVGGDARPRQ